MRMTGFLDFDLVVWGATPWCRGYKARLLRSPAGGAEATLRWPSAADFAKLLERLNLPEERGLRGGTCGIRKVVGKLDRAGSLEVLDVAAELGAILFAFLFQGKLGEGLRNSLDLARRQEAGLALRMHLSGAPELATLPWEYLYDPTSQRFLVESDNVEVARILGSDPGRPRPLGPMIRILAIGADPFGVLSAKEEVRKLQSTSWSPSGVAVEVLTPPTLDKLGEALGEDEFDILHFAGHGRSEPKEHGSELVFEQEDGRAAYVPANTLASILARHPRLQVVVLNACRTGQDALHDLLPGMAQALVQHRVRTVVAMQAEVSDPIALSFAQEFYRGFAATRSVEYALALGRRKMIGVENSVMEWALPCLFTCEDALARPPRRWPGPVGAAAAFMAGLALCHWFPEQCRTLSISYPADHAEVGNPEDIKGTSCLLPKTQDPWIVVYSPTDQLYYPNQSKAVIYPDGHWVSKATTIGTAGDGGKSFALIVALADEDGSRRLAASTDGVKALPDGVQPYQEITVTRRK